MWWYGKQHAGRVPPDFIHARRQETTQELTHQQVCIEVCVRTRASEHARKLAGAIRNTRAHSELIRGSTPPLGEIS